MNFSEKFRILHDKIAENCGRISELKTLEIYWEKYYEEATDNSCQFKDDSHKVKFIKTLTRIWRTEYNEKILFFDNFFHKKSRANKNTTIPGLLMLLANPGKTAVSIIEKLYINNEGDVITKNFKLIALELKENPALLSAVIAGHKSTYLGTFARDLDNRLSGIYKHHFSGEMMKLSSKYTFAFKEERRPISYGMSCDDTFEAKKYVNYKNNGRQKVAIVLNGQLRCLNNLVNILEYLEKSLDITVFIATHLVFITSSLHH